MKYTFMAASMLGLSIFAVRWAKLAIPQTVLAISSG
jgi:hypothetical protein